MIFLKGIFIITTSEFYLPLICININLLLVILILNTVIGSIGDENLQTWEFFFMGWFSLAQWGLEFIMNLVVTILIAYKAWFVFIFSKKKPLLKKHIYST